MVKTKIRKGPEIENSGPESAEKFTRALALYHAGQIPQAVKSCEQILSKRPQHAGTLHLLGLLAMETGRSDSAVRLFGQAAEFDPVSAICFANLGSALSQANRLPEALTAYRRALELGPNDAAIYNNIGNVLKEMGRSVEAIASYRSALKISPTDSTIRINFCEAFWNVECTTADDGLKDDLLDCLRQKNIDCRNLTKAAISLLRHQPEINRLLTLMNNKQIDMLEAEAESGELYRILSDSLLTALMERVIITDPTFEQLLTLARRTLLYHADQSHSRRQIWQGHQAFICALAQQCSMNEFIWSIIDNEAERLDKLYDRFIASDNSISSGSDSLVALLCCYRPFDSLVNSHELQKYIGPETDPDYRRLIESLAAQSKIGLNRRDQIEMLRPIKDDISLKVQNQYEENTFPHWCSINLPKPRKMSAFFAKLFPRLKLVDEPNLLSPEILVAGCGTGRSSIFIATLIENSRVLAVDLSRNALAYAAGKTEELQISSIKFMLADILDLRNFNRKFDIIESVGVLHHMREPLTGWQILIDLLKPGGLMKIGLYSEMARRHIVAARKFIAERGYQATAHDIRRFRRELLNLPESEMTASIKSNRDFYLLSECRDMLFHAQEHRFDLALVSDYIRQTGLEFVGFEPVDVSVRRQYLDRFPDDPDMISLKNWYHLEQELPDIFVGMYQFWLRKRSADD